MQAIGMKHGPFIITALLAALLCGGVSGAKAYTKIQVLMVRHGGLTNSHEGGGA
jgi:hypothetical protein